MGDQRYPARPEPGILGGPGDFAAEFGRELAEDGGDVDADLLEHPPVHDRHRAAAAARALPLGAHEAAGRPRPAIGAGIIVLDRLERRADPVAQGREPRGGFGFPVGCCHSTGSLLVNAPRPRIPASER